MRRSIHCFVTNCFACGRGARHARRRPERAATEDRRRNAQPHDASLRYGAREASIDRWKDDYEKRKTPEEIAAYQKRLHDAFISAVGGLPERTPLNPQVVGTVARKGYRVEKIIFESQPKHYVTGLLFVPDVKRFKAPYPGVLVPCGHAFEAKGYPDYQSMGGPAGAQRHGGVCLRPHRPGRARAIHGQGRLAKTVGHRRTHPGRPMQHPAGRNTALFEIWDGMRAIDYLQSRPEVDPKHIGCTGNSGGATPNQLPDGPRRPHPPAAPSCYLTSTEREMELRGADDAETADFQLIEHRPARSRFHYDAGALASSRDVPPRTISSIQRAHGTASAMPSDCSPARDFPSASISWKTTPGTTTTPCNGRRRRGGCRDGSCPRTR